MGRKRLSVEQIIQKLREAELELARGQTAPQVVKKLGVTGQTYYRWRKAGALEPEDKTPNESYGARRMEANPRCCPDTLNETLFELMQFEAPGAVRPRRYTVPTPGYDLNRSTGICRSR